MVDKTHTQQRIKNIVGAYKELFPQEYELVKEAVEMQRRLQRDEFGSTGTDGVLKRALIEWPEKLHTMITDQLDPEEMQYFISKECARWFTKTFREFALAEEV